jgi:hypothetical protein
MPQLLECLPCFARTRYGRAAEPLKKRGQGRCLVVS